MDRISNSVVYLSRFASIAAFGKLNRSAVMEESKRTKQSKGNDQKRLSLENIFKNTFKQVSTVSTNAVETHSSGSSNSKFMSDQEQIETTEFFQVILIATLEKLSLSAKAILSIETRNVSLSYEREYADHCVDELIPLVNSFAWLVPRAAAELGPMGISPRIQSSLIEAAQHVLCVMLDILEFIYDRLQINVRLEDETKARKDKLKFLTSYSVQTFIKFIDKIQHVDFLVSQSLAASSTAHDFGIFDFSTDPEDEISTNQQNKQKRRSSKSSIGEVLYPTVIDSSRSSPLLVRAQWDTSRSLQGTVDVCFETDDDFQPTAPVLPLNIARGLITRKISMPPPYDKLAEQIGLLNLSDPEKYQIQDVSLSSENKEDGQQETSKGRSGAKAVEIKRTMARVSYLSKSFFAVDWSPWKKGIVELYGDLLSIHKIKLTSQHPMIFGHLRFAKITSVDQGECRIVLEINDKKLKLQLVEERWSEWKDAIETACRQKHESKHK